MNQARARAYLLGRASEVERNEIESRLFEDDDFDSLLQGAEADLLDDWARGCLSPQDADAVRRRFPVEKLHLAKLLARRSGLVASRRDRSVPRWLAAAVVLCVLGGSGYLLRRSSETPPGAPVVLSPAESRVQIFALNTPGTRGVSVPVFRLARETAIVRITVPAEGRNGKHAIEIESAGPPVRQEATPSSGVLTIELPAAPMTAGNCDLLVFEPGGALLATYAFRIERD